jgi:transcriptional regulator with XRE-family HTH domain
MARPKTADKPIIEKALARRMEEACNVAKHVPAYNYGRLRWIKDELEKHGVSASKETIRKWFAGEARPRSEKLRVLARILRVDEAWLAFGTKPMMSADKEQKANADGSVNLVAGLFAMSGASYGWVTGNESVHFHAIVQGHSYPVFVAVGTPNKAGFKFVLPVHYEGNVNIGVVKRGPLSYDLYRIPDDMISKSGLNKGGFVELSVEDKDSMLLAAGNRAPKIEDLMAIGQ